MVKPRRHRRDVSVGDHIHEDWRQPMARFTWWMVIYVDGILLGIFWNFMVISWDFIGFHGISWDFMEFHGDFTGFTGDFMVISWWFHGHWRDFMGFPHESHEFGQHSRLLDGHNILQNSFFKVFWCCLYTFSTSAGEIWRSDLVFRWESAQPNEGGKSIACNHSPRLFFFFICFYAAFFNGPSWYVCLVM